MNDIIYRIKYKRGEFEVEVQGDKDWVEKKFKELAQQAGIEKAPSVAAMGERAQEGEGLPDSLVDLLLAKGNPSTHTDITMVWSYWLSKKKGLPCYNVNDIEDCYFEARIPRPSNTHQFMNENQGKGLLMPTPEKKDGKKAWIITRTGEEYVEQMNQ